jgi:hypothetical protein
VRIFVFLHVATMFTAVAASVGPNFLLRRVAGSGDVPAIRKTFALGAPLSKAIGPLFTLGAALGIVAIFTNDLNPFEPFLVIAYVMFVAATVVGLAFDAPWERRVTQLAAESPDDAPSAALAAVLHDGRMVWVAWFDRLIIVAFVFDMVIKPFS